MVNLPKPHTPDFEAVQIGSKPFQLFPQDKTQKRFTDVGKTYIYDRYISFDSKGVLPVLPIRLYAGATHASRINALSPYTDDRYRFTEREIDPEQRAHILDTKDREKEIDYERAPLCMDASIHTAVLRSMKLTEQTQTLPDPLLPKVKKILSRLRFHVLLPRKDTLDLKQPLYDTFVAKPDETALLLGELSFRQFTTKDSPSDRGYFLMIPSDENIIQKIQGQFIMIG